MLLSILVLQIIVRGPDYASILLFAAFIRQDILIHQKVNSAKLVLRNIIMSTHGGTMFISFYVETSKNLIIGSLTSLSIQQLFEQFYLVNLVSGLHLFEQFFQKLEVILCLLLGRRIVVQWIFICVVV